MKLISTNFTKHQLVKRLTRLVMVMISTPLVCSVMIWVSSEVILPETWQKVNGKELVAEKSLASTTSELTPTTSQKIAWWFVGSLASWLMVETIVTKKSGFSDGLKNYFFPEQALDKITKTWFSFREIPAVFSQQKRIQKLEADLVYYQEQLEQTTQQHQVKIATLIAHLDLTKAELEQAKALEQYAIDENQELETINQELQEHLNLAQAQIYYLQYSLDQVQNHLPASFSLTETEQFLLAFSTEARAKLTNLSQTDSRRYQKVFKTLNMMSYNLRHPSLQTHEYNSLSGPKGEKMFESYVEHRTPGAWRVFWYYGPGKQFLTIYDIRPHP